MKGSRSISALFIALLPSTVAKLCYRLLFGYKIGKRVKIGFSMIDAKDCEIGDDVTIGHFNLFVGTKKLSIGEHTRIGLLNVFRGGDEIRIGRYCEILRLNEINSIPDPEVVNEIDPRFILGDASMLGASHKLDFTDRIEIGRNVIVGGRNSTFWSHNRQMTAPIVVGDFCYLGSEIRVAPGCSIPRFTVVGMGSVIAKQFTDEKTMIAGVPARVIKPLDDDGIFLVTKSSRRDVPDSLLQYGPASELQR